MPALVETQRLLRAALADDAPGAPNPLLALLRGGAAPADRLSIHRRHYEASLAGALTQKFPAAVWYAGSEFVAQAARLFVRRSPPRAPCIAEYGEAFPAFLAALPGAARAPGLRELARLDWHLGHVSIAIDAPAVGIEAFAGIAPAALCDLALATQSGLRYLAAPFPVDTLMQIHLQQREEISALTPQDVRLEIRGARGAFGLRRLDPGDFAFRAALAAGRTLGEASEEALARDEDFDPGRAFVACIADGLITGFRPHRATGASQ